jgi:hypothetical protein
MSNFSNNALPVEEIGSSRVLPAIHTTDTGGNTALYEFNQIGGKKSNKKWDKKDSKKGGKKGTARKNKRSKRTRKQRR